MDPRRDHRSMSYRIDYPGNLDSGTVTGHHDNCERLLRRLVRVRAADHCKEVCALAVPSRTVSGVMLLPTDHPMITVPSRECPYSIARIGRVEIGAAGNLGKSQCREARSIRGQVRSEELAFLLGGAVTNYRFEAESGGQQRARDIDINRSEFLGGDRKIDRRQTGAAELARYQSAGKARFDHFFVERSNRVKAIFRPRDVSNCGFD